MVHSLISCLARMIQMNFCTTQDTWYGTIYWNRPGIVPCLRTNRGRPRDGTKVPPISTEVGLFLCLNLTGPGSDSLSRIMELLFPKFTRQLGCHILCLKSTRPRARPKTNQVSLPAWLNQRSTFLPAALQILVFSSDAKLHTERFCTI